MREEVDEEISTEKIGTKLLEDIRVLNLKRVEHVSPDIVLCAVIVKFGLGHSIFYPPPPPKDGESYILGIRFKSRKIFPFGFLSPSAFLRPKDGDYSFLNPLDFA